MSWCLLRHSENHALINLFVGFFLFCSHVRRDLSKLHYVDQCQAKQRYHIKCINEILNKNTHTQKTRHQTPTRTTAHWTLWLAVVYFEEYEWSTICQKIAALPSKKFFAHEGHTLDALASLILKERRSVGEFGEWDSIKLKPKIPVIINNRYGGDETAPLPWWRSIRKATCAHELREQTHTHTQYT